MGEQARDLDICCRARIALTLVGTRLGDHQFIRDQAERGLTVAHRLGVPSTEVLLRSRLAYANFLSGAWDQSLQNSGEAIALARRVGHPRDLAYALAERAMSLAFQGASFEAAACIGEVRLAFGGRLPIDRYIFGLVDIVETFLALEQGEVERALAIARPLVHAPVSGATTAGLTISYMHVGLALLAEGQARTGDPESALETARKIVSLAPVGAPYLAALASRAEGLALRALGQQEAAIICFGSAQDNFAALEMPFEAAKSLLEQATSAVAVRPELAMSTAQQSLAIFERLGAQHYAERTRRLLRGFRISTLATRRARLGEGFVSARERGYAKPSVTPYTIPTSASFFDSNVVKPDPYDPEQSKKLLAEAGYPKGFDTKVYDPGTAGTLPVVLSGYWKAIGINAVVLRVDYAVLGSLYSPKQKPEIWNNLSATQGPKGFGFEKMPVVYHSKKSSFKNHNNSRLDELIDKFPTVADPVERKKVALEATLLAMNERSLLTYLYTDTVVAFGSKVGGLAPIQNIPSLAVAFETITHAK